MIRKLLKLIFFLAILGGIGVAGFAYFGDLSPATQEESVTVTLDGS